MSAPRDIYHTYNIVDRTTVVQFLERLVDCDDRAVSTFANAILMSLSDRIDPRPAPHDSPGQITIAEALTDATNGSPIAYPA